MSALGRTNLNGLAGGARIGGHFAGDPKRGPSAGEAFDATLAESAGKATKDGKGASGLTAPSVAKSEQGEDAVADNGAASAAQAQGGDVISEILNLASPGSGAAAVADAAIGSGEAQASARAVSYALAEMLAKSSAKTAAAPTHSHADQVPAHQMQDAVETDSGAAHSSLDHAAVGAREGEAPQFPKATKLADAESAQDMTNSGNGAGSSSDPAQAPRAGAADKTPASQSNAKVGLSPAADPALAAVMASTQSITTGASFGAEQSSSAAVAAAKRGGGSSQPGGIGKAGTSVSSTSVALSAADRGVSQVAPGSAGATINVHVVDMKTWHAPVAETPPPARDNSFRTASVPATPAARDEAAQRAPETPPPARISLPADGQASIGAAAVAGAPIAENSAAESGSGTRADASAAAPGAPAPNISSAPRRDVEVTLQPSELGGVSVRMKSVGDRLELTFVAEKGDTARMIEARRTRLENQLRDAGLGAGGVEISVAAKPIAENVVDAPAAGGSSSGFSTDGGRADDQAPSSRQALPGRNKETASDGSGETSNDRQDARCGLGLYL